MIKRIQFLVSGANATLKPLGKTLFYLYLVLFFLGCAGVFFGITTFILKIANVGSAVLTPWWEIGMLLLVSLYTTRTFMKESYNLIGKDKLQTVVSHESDTPNVLPLFTMQKPANSNVIPFTKRNENKP